MARQSGLGPQGRAAVQRAADEMHAPVIGGRADEGPVNPAVLSTEEPGEEDQVPDNWFVFPSSSRCQEAAYDSRNQRLYVRFVKPHPEGTPWIYEGIPSNVWKNFRRVASPGQYVNRVLNSFDYHPGDF